MKWVDPTRELARLQRQLEHLARAFNHCEPSWFIDIEWIDASNTRNVDLRQPLNNRHVETRKCTRGKFVTVQEGRSWRDPHVVISMDRTDELSEITVVPLLCVKNAEVMESKTPLQAHRARTFREKQLLRFTDRSVKRVGLTRRGEVIDGRNQQ